MKRFTRIVRRRREPDEIPTARVAVRNHCLECVGYVVKDVERCTAPECWLYPWRLGKTPATLKRAPTGGGFKKQHANSRNGSPDCRTSPAGRAVGPARPELASCGAQNAHEGD